MRRSVSVWAVLVGLGGAIVILVAATNVRCANAGEGQAACMAEASSMLFIPVVLLVAAAVTSIWLLSRIH